ncbi:sce7726 family protein [Buttiauxella sp. S04-F03]|uniref:sce7726 family protein n=1 Tax=Buttiauxella sp. S04-F03 TaxID=2904525 RepID=UPI001E2DD63F|nr:sce7726 family protein [Buttiauxella sp. S04-F03]MCE0813553.1 sce7726 family protein [Buttiauxella sp. S04-F03]
MSNFNPFEKEIKKTVLNHLLTKGKINNETIVINELTIDSFARRVDLAILVDGKIIAYEIKSDADSLYRLSGQLEKYKQYFDKIIVVTTIKHVENILTMIPKNIEVWEVAEEKIKIKKRGKLSKIEDKKNYLDLLRVQDMRKLAKNFKIPLGSSGKREIKDILKKNLNQISLQKLKLFVIEVISQRYKNTSSNFIENIKIGNKVTINDLNRLSPYSQKIRDNRIFEGSILGKLK